MHGDKLKHCIEFLSSYFCSFFSFSRFLTTLLHRLIYRARSKSYLVFASQALPLICMEKKIGSTIGPNDIVISSFPCNGERSTFRIDQSGFSY